MDQKLTPLLKALKDKLHTSSYHVPGHKNGNVFLEEARPFFDSILRLDSTEIEGLDDLHDPGGVIKEAEDLLADLYGTVSSSFLVGGSTSGNLAMLLSTVKRGQKVLVQRNSHQSVFHGLELAGAVPVFLHPDTDSGSGIALGIHEETLQTGLEAHTDAAAVLLTNPTYEGYGQDLRKHTEICRRYEAAFLVDEAHGAHFFRGNKEWFPESALQAGADLVVQSAHKTLPAMTMGAWIHRGTDYISEKRLRRALMMVQSSSPSYPLMASLDAARAYMASKQDWEETSRQIQSRKQQLSTFVSLLPDYIGPYELDPLKINLFAGRERGEKPEQWQKMMQSSRAYAEMISPVHLLAVLSLDQAENDRLLQQLIRVFSRETFLPGSPHSLAPGERQPSRLMLSFGEMEERMEKETQWEESEGEIAAETIVPYPPGVPLLIRGERVTKKHLEKRARLLHRGVRIKGGAQKLIIFK
ncbi:aminotransferase class I/II-fold pyridoxal phosphate-dependent enzyme [Alkalicoccus halolimnae]|uniref:Aminotransferase class I/II-fold pyridoxal phosphate-dependent enzyme n=1 Tax=Alkalicoccus halolimnae TaxID=1667239 RepID=A0A5C7FEG4_9BACI|nr:aminotransferase class I/II-fold pyridoxal phosphate-dependent enzyme [Alkalicoccus halolimnae]TXF82152.1 aminotransferase class I/II-fold pyridoxal phosphate-dependent enzyme [Alkalicoccus halolimnae]